MLQSNPFAGSKVRFARIRPRGRGKRRRAGPRTTWPVRAGDPVASRYGVVKQDPLGASRALGAERQSASERGNDFGCRQRERVQRGGRRGAVASSKRLVPDCCAVYARAVSAKVDARRPVGWDRYSHSTQQPTRSGDSCTLARTGIALRVPIPGD